MAPGQTREMLTFLVKSPDGLAVQNADVSFHPEKPPESAIVGPQGRQVNKYGVQAHPYRLFFVTKTNAAGQAQAPKADFQNALTDKIIVSVKAEGYQPYRQTFDLDAQKPVAIVLTPLPPQQ